MVNSSASQRGGESNFRALNYQKMFIAYLAIEMLEKKRIKKITCEQMDDVEVEEDSKLAYYQIKTTTKDSLSKSEVFKSLELFSDISKCNIEKSNKSEFALVSNARILKFRDIQTMHPFEEIEHKIKNEIKAQKGIGAEIEFLNKIYFMRGPSLEGMKSHVLEILVKVLKERYAENYSQFDVFNIREKILTYINDMCPGPSDLKDLEIIKNIQKKQRLLEHKSITLEKLNSIIEENRNPPVIPLMRVSKKMTYPFNIRVSDPNKEQSEKIHDLIDEFNSFNEEQEELRLAYLQHFNKKSAQCNLHNDQKFLKFLGRLIHNVNNKHLLWELLFVLQNLIKTSKLEKDESFIAYIKKEYFELFKQRLETRNETFEYCLSKIKQIIEEMNDVIPLEELCEMYWKRLVWTICNMKETGITDGTLGNCIDDVNKCIIKKQWRKWLIKKDKYSDIKNGVFKELANL